MKYSLLFFIINLFLAAFIKPSILISILNHSSTQVYAVTGVIRPDGDVNATWTTTGVSRYTELTSANDLVTQPAVPDTNDYISDGTGASQQFTMDNSISNVNSVSAIDFWAYGYASKTPANLNLDIYYDGSLQNSTTVSLSKTYDWYHNNLIGLNLTQTQLDSLELAVYPQQGGRTYYIAALYAEITYTETAAVSISLNTDGAVTFGTQPLDSTNDTTSSGINDVETISVDSGPADLSVSSSTFSDGSNTWSLGSTDNGADTVFWEFSPDGSSWNTFAVADTSYTLATNVAQGSTQDLYLRLTTPTTTSSYNQHSSTVTITASAP